MESSSSRFEEERRTQDDLRKQIARLQAQLKEVPVPLDIATPSSPKRKPSDPSLLAPSTPSPKKRKLSYYARRESSAPSVSFSTLGSSIHGTSMIKSEAQTERQYPKLAPSNLLNKLVTLNHKVRDHGPGDRVTRSSGFAESPSNPVAAAGAMGVIPAIERDERLAIIEDLEPGPVEHTPPSDDPEFQRLEPNSGIRLSSRCIPHDDLQDHLRGRYYLSPSRLYSAVRLLPDKQGYDVPVPGDWITIAVVAERGPLKFSKAPVTVGLDEGIEKREDWKSKKTGKEKEQAETSKPTGKKYVNLKLIDFGARSRSSSSASGGKAIIRGDAFLSLLLFESDAFDLITNDGDTRPHKVYRGGSRGAFEALSKVKEGDVIALLNPRILKPYQRSNDNPHPTDNILALTPESAASIMVLGRAHDLGMCTVLKKDGKACGSWCDKRVSDVCEWHLQNAVQRSRAGRAEFSIGTMGMSSSSVAKRKPAYDPARQWGLKPEPDAGASTYVVSGHIVNGSGADPRSIYTTENLGREGQAKAKRKLSSKDADKALKGLLERDKEGMRAVVRAREAGKMKIAEREENGKKEKLGKGRGEGKRGDEDGRRIKSMEDETLANRSVLASKNAYSAEVIKNLGFDPIARAGQRRGTDSDMKKKLNALVAVQSSRKEMALGPRPGQKIRSGVIPPQHNNRVFPTDPGPGASHDGHNDSNEIPALPSELDSGDTAMIDLDD